MKISFSPAPAVDDLSNLGQVPIFIKYSTLHYCMTGVGQTSTNKCNCCFCLHTLYCISRATLPRVLQYYCCQLQICAPFRSVLESVWRVVSCPPEDHLACEALLCTVVSSYHRLLFQPRAVNMISLANPFSLKSFQTLACEKGPSHDSRLCTGIRYNSIQPIRVFCICFSEYCNNTGSRRNSIDMIYYDRCSTAVHRYRYSTVCIPKRSRSLRVVS